MFFCLCHHALHVLFAEPVHVTGDSDVLALAWQAMTNLEANTCPVVLLYKATQAEITEAQHMSV